MHHVYLLHSLNHDKYYVGESADVEQRLLFHNELSESSWTRNYRPWTLACKLTVVDYSAARKLENYIKRQKSKEYVKRIITENDLAEWLVDKFNSSVD